MATEDHFAYRPWLLALVLVIVTVLAYLPALHGGFTWDDDIWITGNRLIQASDGLYRLWFTTEAANYYPLTWSFCWLEWRFWGDSAAGYHAVNVLLHAVNAVLVWMVLQRLKVRGAWLAGLVFAVHPVNVATVAWISEQKNTVSMLFYLAAILLYLRFDEEGRWRWYGLSLGAFLLALFSKTAVVMLPVVLLGCVWWLRGQLRRQDLLRSLPFFALSLVMGLVTIWFEHNRDLGGRMTRTDGFLSHLVIAGQAPWFYLYKAVLPLKLSVIYPKWDIDPSLWISYLPGMALVGCLTLFWWKRQAWGRPLLFALGYFVVMFFPVLGFFDQAYYWQSLVADHWQYYSIVGPIALVIGAGAVVCRRMGSQRRAWGAAAAVAVLTVLGVATWQRALVYANEETLWRDTLAKNPNNWLAHYNLGQALARAGRQPEAVQQYQWALRINPNMAMTHDRLANALLLLGRVPEAVQHYEQALRISSALASTQEEPKDALRRLSTGQVAVPRYGQAATDTRDLATTHVHLGNALLLLGNRQEAISHYQQALRIEPDDPEALNNLAWLLATLAPADGGDPVRAVSLAEQACQLTRDRVAPYLDTLAAAYAAAGRFSDAIAAAEKALELARAGAGRAWPGRSRVGCNCIALAGRTAKPPTR